MIGYHLPSMVWAHHWIEMEGFFELLPMSVALSAKFLVFLRSSWLVCQVWYKLYRVSAKFLALYAMNMAPSWQKIANSKPLAIFYQLEATQYKNHKFQCRRVQWLWVANFCQWFRVGREHKTWQKRPRTWQKQTKKEKMGGKPDIERCKGIHPATSTS